MINSTIKKRILSSVVLFPLSIFLIIKGSILFKILILVCFLISFNEWRLMIKKGRYLFLGTFFLIFSFYCTMKLRFDFDDNYNIFIFVFLICISSDIGGYLFGNIFKGPKLTKISPKKTYSGMIGAYLLSIIFSITFFKYLYKNNESIFISEVLLVVILISTVSQLGDLLISYFKRISNIKDTGKIIPGHGGLLDRVDGMIFAFPFSYILFTVNKFNIF